MRRLLAIAALASLGVLLTQAGVRDTLASQIPDGTRNVWMWSPPTGIAGVTIRATSEDGGVTCGSVGQALETCAILGQSATFSAVDLAHKWEGLGAVNVAQFVFVLPCGWHRVTVALVRADDDFGDSIAPWSVNTGVRLC